MVVAGVVLGLLLVVVVLDASAQGFLQDRNLWRHPRPLPGARSSVG